MHAWTHSSWVESPGRHTPNLIYYRSALPATDLLQCLLLYLWSASMRRCLGINGSWTPRKGHHHRCHRRARSHAFVRTRPRASVHSISPWRLIPNYTHLLLTCSAVSFFLLIKAVSVRSCWILKCLLHQCCCVTAGFGEAHFEAPKKKEKEKKEVFEQ